MDTLKTGEFISALRREKGLTQAQLAELIHVSDKAVSRWETGRGFPDIGNLEMLSECLGVSAAELIRGERIGSGISREEANEITSQGLSLTKAFVSKNKYINTALGFIMGLTILIVVLVHMMSPQYITDPDALRIEILPDGTMLAAADRPAAGYETERVRDPESGRQQVFIGCYKTGWDMLFGKGDSPLAVIGSSDDIDEVYFYPSAGEDILLYGENDSVNGGTVTLPRLVYNYWIVIGLILTAGGCVLLYVCRHRYYADRILKTVLLPAAFTVSIPVCLAGRFDEVYNAEYYFTGILLLTFALYLLFRVILLRLHRRTNAVIKQEQADISQTLH